MYVKLVVSSLTLSSLDFLVKACPEPDILDAEYVIPDSLTYTSTFYYKCREGLSPMGNQLATCAKNSTWTYIKCTEPGKINTNTRCP